MGRSYFVNFFFALNQLLSFSELLQYARDY